MLQSGTLVASPGGLRIRRFGSEDAACLSHTHLLPCCASICAGQMLNRVHALTAHVIPRQLHVRLHLCFSPANASSTLRFHQPLQACMTAPAGYLASDTWRACATQVVPGGGEFSLRTNDSQFLAQVDRWWGILLPRIQSYLYSNGGPVILVQVTGQNAPAALRAM